METISLDSIGNFFSGDALGFFFIKSFSVVFSLLFTTYAIVIFKQIQGITKTVQNSRNAFIVSFTFFQIIIGFVLLVFSILFV
ncbi:MAG: DUF5657 family protein [Patescibacteria group bacterium]